MFSLPPRRPPIYFYIRSHMNDKVLDIKGEEAGEGGVVITYTQNEDESDNQLWYEGRHGFIRSKLNNYLFDSSGESACLTADGQLTSNQLLADALSNIHTIVYCCM